MDVSLCLCVCFLGTHFNGNQNQITNSTKHAPIAVEPISFAFLFPFWVDFSRSFNYISSINAAQANQFTFMILPANTAPKCSSNEFYAHKRNLILLFHLQMQHELLKNSPNPDGSFENGAWHKLGAALARMTDTYSLASNFQVVRSFCVPLC